MEPSLRCMGKSFWGSNSSIFIFFLPSFSVRVKPLKERICPTRSKFFLLRIGPFWRGHVVQRQKQAVTKVISLLKKWRENMTVFLHTVSQVLSRHWSINTRRLMKLGKENLIRKEKSIRELFRLTFRSLTTPYRHVFQCQTFMPMICYEKYS